MRARDDGAYRPTTLQDNAGNVTGYSYQLGHPYQTTYPGGESVRNAQYDSGGRVLS
jgi:YD repeat-containing protein